MTQMPLVSGSPIVKALMFVVVVLVAGLLAGCQFRAVAPGGVESDDGAVQGTDTGVSSAEEAVAPSELDEAYPTEGVGADETGGAEANAEKERTSDTDAADADDRPGALEVEPIEIVLDGGITNPDAEISSMAWLGDTLILMPQYPGWAKAEGMGDGVVYAIDGDDIRNYIDGTAEPITPREIPFDADGLDGTIDGFEGFEALAFDGDRFVLAVEAETEAVGEDGSTMYGFLVGGDVAPDGSGMAVDSSVLTSVDLPVNLPNMSIESLLVDDDRLIAIFEANGAIVNPTSDAATFNADLTPADWIGFPTIEYRVTDATAADADGTFWVTNYYWPGEADLLQPALDEVIAMHGEGESHASTEGVERLVQMQVGAGGITLTDAPPVQLELVADGTLRNWEGIVRLDDRGWLIATDSFPYTMIAFVPMPAN